MEQVEMKDECLLLCCPTVPRFSLQDKLWSKILPLQMREAGANPLMYN